MTWPGPQLLTRGGGGGGGDEKKGQAGTGVKEGRGQHWDCLPCVPLTKHL